MIFLCDLCLNLGVFCIPSESLIVSKIHLATKRRKRLKGEILVPLCGDAEGFGWGWAALH